jgi:(p)ppGpp synthase/HD superfamily hydrolase
VVEESSMAAYSERYAAALALATRAHASQVRKASNDPYIVHPVHVSVILLRHGFSEDVAIAGLLHDVVEDQSVPLGRIEAQFGPAVAEMVGALTERKREGELERPWEVRKREALEQIQAASRDAAAVKAADALHSVRSLASALRDRGPRAWENFSRGPEKSLGYYRRVAAIVRQRLGIHPLVSELEEALGDLERITAGRGRC